MESKKLKEEIKLKAKELANEAYWRTKPHSVTHYEVSDPNVEEILQKMAHEALTLLLERAREMAIWGVGFDSVPDSTEAFPMAKNHKQIITIEDLEALVKEVVGE